MVDVDYAKSTPTDISIRITVTNAGPDEATIDVLPTMWFRNTWGWGRGHPVPEMRVDGGTMMATHWRSGTYHLDPGPLPDGSMPKPALCSNETNDEALFGTPNITDYPKDGIDRHVRLGEPSINPENRGTKGAWWYRLTVPPGESQEVRLRLWKSPENHRNPDALGSDFDELFATRQAEADEFYGDLAPENCPGDELVAMRMAFAGMIWSKQFYRYDVQRWLAGDPGQPAPPPPQTRRNHNWRHVDCYDVISMPDAWEYPWFAAWDLAFHTVVFTHIDPAYAKYQLLLMCREWYMHPNGALPAYEWNFGDTNPPVHAWAALRVFEIDGTNDYAFLAEVFQKLLMNFTWWVNRVDSEGNNVFQGGFLGLDNVGPINRSQLPKGCGLEQADGTAWMAFYCLSMLRIALRLAEHDAVYDAMALKFAEHFAAITDGMAASGMWDWQEGFFYDQLLRPDGSKEPLKVRSIVGLIPILAAAWIQTDEALRRNARLFERFADFLRRRGLDTIDSGRAGFVIPLPGGAQVVAHGAGPGAAAAGDAGGTQRGLLPQPARVAQLVEASSGRAVLGDDRRPGVLPRRLRTRRIEHTDVRRELELARTGLVPDQPPRGRGPRAVLHVPGRFVPGGVPDGQRRHGQHARGGRRVAAALGQHLPARRGRPTAGVRRHREVPDRPAVEFRTVLLRVLPRRQWRRAGGKSPDRMDRAGGGPDHRTTGVGLGACCTIASSPRRLLHRCWFWTPETDNRATVGGRPADNH